MVRIASSVVAMSWNRAANRPDIEWTKAGRLLSRNRAGLDAPPRQAGARAKFRSVIACATVSSSNSLKKSALVSHKSQLASSARTFAHCLANSLSPCEKSRRPSYRTACSTEASECPLSSRLGTARKTLRLTRRASISSRAAGASPGQSSTLARSISPNLSHNTLKTRAWLRAGSGSGSTPPRPPTRQRRIATRGRVKTATWPSPPPPLASCREKSARHRRAATQSSPREQHGLARSDLRAEGLCQCSCRRAHSRLRHGRATESAAVQ